MHSDYKILWLLWAFCSSWWVAYAQHPGTELTASELKWLKDHEQQLLFAPNPSWAPIDFIDSAGRHQGVVADYLAIFQKRTGVVFQQKRFSSWNEVLQGLKAGEADFTGAIQQSPTRDSFLVFSQSYLNIPLVVLVREGFDQKKLSSMDGIHLAVVKGYASNSFIRHKYPGVVIQEYADEFSALMQTSLGNTDGTVIDLMSASYLIEKYGISNLDMGKTLDYTWSLKFAARTDNAQLIFIFNKLLASMSEEEHKAIYQKWVNLEQLENDSFFEIYIKEILVVLAFFGFITAVIVVHNLVLRRQVRRKTAALVNQVREKEKALKRAQSTEDELRKLFNRGDVPRLVYDADTLRILAVNYIACRCYGHAEEEMLSLTIDQLWVKEDFNRYFKKRAQRTNDLNSYGVCKHLKADGGVIKVKVFANDNIFQHRPCVTLSCVDLTKEIAAYEALKVSNQRYQYVTKATNEAIWDWDFEVGSVFFGHGFQRLFGHEFVESTGSEVAMQFIKAEDRERVLQSFWNAVKGKDHYWEASYEYLKADGTYACVLNKGIIIRDKKGKAVRMIGAIEDVTDRIKAFRSLQEQNERLKEIAWIQSHVVRAPLARIMGLVNLMEMSNELNQVEQQELLQYLKISAQEMDDVVHDIVRKAEQVKQIEHMEAAARINSGGKWI